MPLLIKSSYDYGDEFDCKCFMPFNTREDYETWLGDIQRQLDEDGSPIEHYFGTNEYLTISNVEDVVDSLTIIEISDEEQAVLKRLFGNGSFGTGNIFDIGYPLEEENES